MGIKILNKNNRLNAIFIVCIFHGSLVAQDPWDSSTYPDEEGFIKRMQPMVERIAAHGFGVRSLAPSKCPDTGLLVKTWAVEGETIISPYTGRAYIQGPTGYFGPKSRNEKGEIIAFGGDPLKYDLPPATATMILNPNDQQARGFLSIPGNMRQQYHFACKNWARFYPLMKNNMPEAWLEQFHYWVGAYSEARRPSDGGRELLPLSRAHNLVGEEGFLLEETPRTVAPKTTKPCGDPVLYSIANCSLILPKFLAIAPGKQKKRPKKCCEIT
jgi:hypothetical protein